MLWDLLILLYVGLLLDVLLEQIHALLFLAFQHLDLLLLLAELGLKLFDLSSVLIHVQVVLVDQFLLLGRYQGLIVVQNLLLFRQRLRQLILFLLHLA